MSGSLKKPRTQVYRSYLYLNGDEIINSLAALEGGDVDEVLVRQADEGTGEAGGEANLGIARGRGGRKRVTRHEEELRRKRTEHSATALLLRKLHEEEAIGVVEGDYGETVYEQLEEHMLLELMGDIRVHPLHQMITAARSFLLAASDFGISAAEIREMRSVVALLEKIAQAGDDKTRTFLIFAETAGAKDGFRLVIPIHERYLLVPLDDFTGRATFVAQVDRILRSDEELLALRLLRNTPPLALEREGLIEALPDLLEGMREMGIEVSRDDLVLRKPTVVLKPICIYK